MTYRAHMLQQWLTPALVIVLMTPVTADEREEELAIPHDVAIDGAFTPLIARADGRGRGIARVAMTSGGAGGASSTALSFDGEVKIWGPLRITASVSGVIAETTDRSITGRPSTGVTAQLLGEDEHGVDAAAYLTYKPEGFTEPEDEVELIFAIGQAGRPAARHRERRVRPGSGGRRARRRARDRAPRRAGQQPVRRRGKPLPRRARQHEGDGQARAGHRRHGDVPVPPDRRDAHRRGHGDRDAGVGLAVGGSNGYAHRRCRLLERALAVPDRSRSVVVVAFAPHEVRHAALVDVHLVVVTEREPEAVGKDVWIAADRRGDVRLC